MGNAQTSVENNYTYVTNSGDGATIAYESQDEGTNMSATNIPQVTKGLMTGNPLGYAYQNKLLVYRNNLPVFCLHPNLVNTYIKLSGLSEEFTNFGGCDDQVKRLTDLGLVYMKVQSGTTSEDSMKMDSDFYWTGTTTDMDKFVQRLKYMMKMYTSGNAKAQSLMNLAQTSYPNKSIIKVINFCLDYPSVFIDESDEVNDDPVTYLTLLGQVISGFKVIQIDPVTKEQIKTNDYPAIKGSIDCVSSKLPDQSSNGTDVDIPLVINLRERKNDVLKHGKGLIQLNDKEVDLSQIDTGFDSMTRVDEGELGSLIGGMPDDVLNSSDSGLLLLDLTTQPATWTKAAATPVASADKYYFQVIAGDAIKPNLALYTSGSTKMLSSEMVGSSTMTIQPTSYMVSNTTPIPFAPKTSMKAIIIWMMFPTNPNPLTQYLINGDAYIAYMSEEIILGNVSVGDSGAMKFTYNEGMSVHTWSEEEVSSSKYWTIMIGFNDPVDALEYNIPDFFNAQVKTRTVNTSIRTTSDGLTSKVKPAELFVSETVDDAELRGNMTVSKLMQSLEYDESQEALADVIGSNEFYFQTTAAIAATEYEALPYSVGGTFMSILESVRNRISKDDVKTAAQQMINYAGINYTDLSPLKFLNDSDRKLILSSMKNVAYNYSRTENSESATANLIRQGSSSIANMTSRWIDRVRSFLPARV